MDYALCGGSQKLRICIAYCLCFTVDTTPPTILTCPGNVLETIELGTSGVTVDWEEPTFSDVSDTAMVTSQTHFSGTFFLVGTTVVEYEITDASLNSATCSFSVTIITGMYG